MLLFSFRIKGICKWHSQDQLEPGVRSMSGSPAPMWNVFALRLPQAPPSLGHCLHQLASRTRTVTASSELLCRLFGTSVYCQGQMLLFHSSHPARVEARGRQASKAVVALLARTLHARGTQ